MAASLGWDDINHFIIDSSESVVYAVEQAKLNLFKRYTKNTGVVQYEPTLGRERDKLAATGGQRKAGWLAEVEKEKGQIRGAATFEESVHKETLAQIKARQTAKLENLNSGRILDFQYGRENGYDYRGAGSFLEKVYRPWVEWLESLNGTYKPSQYKPIFFGDQRTSERIVPGDNCWITPDHPEFGDLARGHEHVNLKRALTIPK